LTEIAMAPDEGRRAFVRDDAHDELSPRSESRRRNEIEHAQDEDRLDEDQADGGPTSSFFSSRRFKIGAAAVALVAIVAGVVWWLNARHYETTDDAFIDTHIVQLSPQVSGRVTRVYVNDNQQVSKGQPLVEIDPADVQAKLAQAQAQAAQSESVYQQDVAADVGLKAQAERAQRDADRYRTLQQATVQAVSQQTIDQALATSQNATAQVAASQAKIASDEAQIAVAKAQVQAAQLNVGYTHIVAPVDGHVAQRSVAEGNYVTPGQALMAIVPLEVWVTANFKETQLDLMRVGQPVTVRVDACPSARIEGRVDSLQRGAGQAFGILPPENATGNFVKVVQRVPVKIVLNNVPKDCPLGPGMSVEPTVRVR
jgi:membrane fusion protein (multidrug efflux system)